MILIIIFALIGLFLLLLSSGYMLSISKHFIPTYIPEGFTLGKENTLEEPFDYFGSGYFLEYKGTFKNQPNSTTITVKTFDKYEDLEKLCMQVPDTRLTPLIPYKLEGFKIICPSVSADNVRTYAFEKGSKIGLLIISGAPLEEYFTGGNVNRVGYTEIAEVNKILSSLE